MRASAVTCSSPAGLCSCRARLHDARVGAAGTLLQQNPTILKPCQAGIGQRACMTRGLAQLMPAACRSRSSISARSSTRLSGSGANSALSSSLRGPVSSSAFALAFLHARRLIPSHLHSTYLLA